MGLGVHPRSSPEKPDPAWGGGCIFAQTSSWLADLLAAAMGKGGQRRHWRLTQDGHAVGCHQAPSSRVVGACQVVEVLLVLVLAAPHHLFILLPAHHLAFVGDGLHIVLILVTGLV